MDTSHQLRMMVYATFFGALTAVGAFIAIPIGPVPIVLQNMFVYLAGLLLGGRWGLASVGVYLLAGALGMPVFAGGFGGIGRFVGPTGGYLIGYLPTVYLIAKIAHRAQPRMMTDVLAMISGTLVLYTFGGMPLSKTLALGMYPFLIGDAIKIAAAAAIAKALRPVVRVTSSEFRVAR